MAHQVVVTEEHYVFKPETKKKLFIFLAVGVGVFILGLVLAMSGAGHHEETKGGHAALQNSEFVASVQQHAGAAESHAAAGHPETAPWLKRLYSSLWMNNVFFAGMGIIGLFFVAIQYAAQAGWSVGVKRIGIAMGSWIPIAGILMLILWFATSHDIFHWTHDDLYGKTLSNGQPNPTYDSIIDNKAPFFFWPLAGGTFPIFFIFRMVLLFCVL
jgi:hypothetical protein